MLNYLFTEMLMVLVDLDHIQERFHVLLDVYLYVILRFQKEELESKDNLWILSNRLINKKKQLTFVANDLLSLIKN